MPKTEERIIVSLKPSDTKKALKACFEVRENVCLVSPPGTCKSSLIGQSAAETGRDLIVCHPSLEDQTEPGGYPWFKPNENHARKYLFGQMWKAVTATKPTVLHLEDFGGGLDAVQKAYMQWLEAREVDGHRLPDCVTITLATNERGHRSGVSGMLETVKGRCTMVNVMIDVEDFCTNLFDRGQSEYRLSEGAILDGALFIQNNHELLSAFDPKADMSNSPTPRNWVHAFRHTMHGLPGHIENALVSGRVGVGAAAAFLAFVKMQRERRAFSLDAILADPVNAPIPEQTSAQWAVSMGLAGRTNEVTVGAVKTYLERMEKENLGEFGALCVQRALRVCPRITNTRAYAELCVGPLGALIQGRVE